MCFEGNSGVPPLFELDAHVVCRQAGGVQSRFQTGAAQVVGGWGCPCCAGAGCPGLEVGKGWGYRRTVDGGITGVARILTQGLGVLRAAVARVLKQVSS